MAITNRSELKEYCLRRLGFPVIEINVDDDQVEDRIDDALDYFFENHYDGTERVFHAQQITQADINNRYIGIPDSIIYVTRVLPSAGSSGAGGLFYPLGDPSLAWNSTSANPLFGSGGSKGAGHAVRTTQDHAGGSGGMDKASFYIQMAGIEEFNQMFGSPGAASEPPIRFSRHMHRVFLDVEWSGIMKVGGYLIVEGLAALDPTTFTDVLDDHWLKRYTTGLIKRQWGANLIKYSGIQLPGGVTFDGDKLYQQALDDIAKLEDEMLSSNTLPVDFYMG